MAPEASDFLYPFIEADERDPGALLVDLTASASAKADESARVRDAALTEVDDVLDAVAYELASRFGRGGCLFTFGNGGSATDADSLAALFGHPPIGAAVPARSLAQDQAVLTALGNDVGFELVFARQLIAHATTDDIALGVSTSGDSENLLRAFAEARARGLATVVLAGGGGGRCAQSPDVDHVLVVRSDSVHRIQEAQAALGLELWSRVQARLGHLDA